MQIESARPFFLEVPTPSRRLHAMPPITVVIFACNDALRVGRALETLWFAGEIVVVDRGSTDRTPAIARLYGARVVAADQLEASPITSSTQDWIFCLNPRESVGDELEASLFEWSLLPAAEVPAGASYSVHVREELDDGWVLRREPETRLVPRHWRLAADGLPVPDPAARLLSGTLCRFSRP